MKKIITYGTFDLFHQGHYNIIKRAKDLGDYLIVGVTSESYDIERGKLNVMDSLLKRIENVRKSGLADEIIVEEYQGQKINDVIKYGIDTLVIGSDWRGKFDYLKNYCQVVYLERTKDISSTQLRETLRDIFRIGIITHSAEDKGVVLETKFVSGLHVESVFSPDLDTAKQFCTAFELDSYHDEMDAFLDGVDIVYIQCDLRDRLRYIRTALLRKKYVICEAPFTLDSEQLAALHRCARENGVLLIENMRLAYLRAFTQLVWLLYGGLIGTVLNVRCSLCTTAFSALSHIVDIAAYPVFATLKLLGNRYSSLSSRTITTENEEAVYQTIHFDYDNSCANIEISSAAGLKNEMVIMGTQGRIEIPDEWWNMGYFEAKLNTHPQPKRYSFNFEGNGIRYLLQEVLIMIKDRRVECTRLFPYESQKIVDTLRALFPEKRMDIVD